MKQLFYGVLFVTAASVGQSCQTKDARYIDLNTGEAVALEKDEQSGLLVDTATGKTVALYVDTKTKDTVWGKTGKVVNGQIQRNKDGDGDYVYVYMDVDRPVESNLNNDGETKVESENGAYEIKNGDYKKEVEKDGDIKIKDGNKKIKIDGETGERKVKYDN
jgi:hypothetical protein